MGTIEYLTCVVTFWKDDAKVFRLETNFLCDLQHILHVWLNNDKLYTKATIEWNGKLITVNPLLPEPIIE